MDPQDIRILSPWEIIVANCLCFAQGGYCQNIPLWSLVAEREVMSQDMFCRYEKNKFVFHREHFPIDPHLKYVHIHSSANGGGGVLHVELTMLDFNELQAACDEHPCKYNLSGRSIQIESETILKTRTCQYFGRGKKQERNPRTVVSTIDPLDTIDIENVSGFFDLLWGKNICCKDWAPKIDAHELQEQTSTGSAAISIRIDQVMELRQKLSQQQVQRIEQILAQDQKPLMALQMQMTMRMVARLSQNSKVLKMGNEELNQYLQGSIENNPALERG